MDPSLFEVFAKEFVTEVNRQRSSINQQREQLLARLRKIDEQRQRLVDVILHNGDAEAIIERLKALETEKADISAQIAATPDDKPILHPSLAELYRQKVGELARLLEDPVSGPEAFDLIRSLIEKIVLQATNGELQIELHGD